MQRFDGAEKIGRGGIAVQPEHAHQALARRSRGYLNQMTLTHVGQRFELMLQPDSCGSLQVNCAAEQFHKRPVLIRIPGRGNDNDIAEDNLVIDPSLLLRFL